MGEISYHRPHHEIKLRILALLDETMWRTARELHATDDRLPHDSVYMRIYKLETENGYVISRMQAGEREYLRTAAGTRYLDEYGIVSAPTP
jgi:hypothetical protein